VVSTTSTQPLGLVTAYNPDFRNGFVSLAAAKFEGRRHPSPVFIEGVALFIDYIFTSWNFRKLYIESGELNVPQFGSGIGWLIEEEGRLRQHRYFGGRFWDEYIMSIYREKWDEFAPKIREFLHGPGPSTTS